MQELALDVRQWGTPEGIGENIHSSLSLGLPELQVMLYTHDGTFVICGSGPSIVDHLDKIREDAKSGKTICAVKGAYDFLVENGITPDLYLSVEPRYRPVRLPQKETTFLLASRVSKQLFEDLKAFKVVLWHSWSEEEYNKLLEHKPCIGGGTTSGLRAVNLAYCLGFRRFKIYGLDSSLGKRGEKRVNQTPLTKDIKTIEVVCGDEVFVTNMAMAAQAMDFQMIYQIMPDVTIEAIGDGLIPAILAERKKQGMVC